MVDWTSARVAVTGGGGFLGGHIVGRLNERGCVPFVPRSAEYDLRQPADVRAMLAAAGPVDVLINLAANVGGIGYNQNNPYGLFYDNIQIGVNVVHQAIRSGVGKFVQVGTVCAYPKFTPAPFKEADLWNGYPEETNAPYGLAKKMLLVQLQAARQEFGFNGIYLLPTNLYGPGDNFNPARSHVIPALIRKCVQAVTDGESEIEVWGSGDASRDFLYVEDAAEAILLAAEKYDRPEPVNLGSGQEVRIGALVHYISQLTGFNGRIRWNSGRPDGQPRRVLNTWRARDELGWTARTDLLDGLARTIEWYKMTEVNLA